MTNVISLDNTSIYMSHELALVEHQDANVTAPAGINKPLRGAVARLC